MLRDGFFNVSHWVFAFQYFNSAATMPFIYDQAEQPESQVKRLKLLNTLMLAINIFVPIVYSLVLIYINIVEVRDGASPISTSVLVFWTYTVSHDMVGVLQLVSGIFLLVAVFKIRSFLLGAGMRTQVDYKTMTVHAASFILYSLTIILLYAIYFVYTSMPDDIILQKKQTITRDCLIVWISTCYTNLIAQACLIWIFLKFRTKKEETQRTKSEHTVQELD